MSQGNASTPSFGDFDPSLIPYQDQVMDDILCNFDYARGSQEILLSGSVGSAKSILMGHLAVRHCLDNHGARFLIGRRSLPDLRDTLYTKIREHLIDEQFTEGYHYTPYDRECRIDFHPWGSQIIARSWADAKYKKLRSLDLSGAAIEELTENETNDAYRELVMRIGRLPHIKQKFIIAATNPDSPKHWAYEHFIEPNSDGRKHPDRHVYYSITTDNPFLPKSYIDKLLATLDKKQALRMIFGQWIEISQDVIYHSYISAKSRRNYRYKLVKGVPIMFAFDFNIGKGKPMSVAVGQYHKSTDEYHWFDVAAVHGARTTDILEELAGRGLFETGELIEIFGDATGDRNDTRSLLTDYDIIKKWLANYRTKPSDGGEGKQLRWTMHVPRANPSIRTRHNIVNGYCENYFGTTKFFLYDGLEGFQTKGCEMLDKGMRLTSLKDGGMYVEDDEPEYQHVTTAVGYCIVYKSNLSNNGKITITPN